MIKKIKIIISNIIIFVILFTVFEAAIYFADYKNNKLKLKFCWDTGQMHTNYNLKGFFNGRSNRGSSGRKPDGLEYKNKTPILIFGCSFAFGQYLNHKKTVSYKLSKLLKRPVYNRSVPGGGYSTCIIRVFQVTCIKKQPLLRILCCISSLRIISAVC